MPSEYDSQAASGNRANHVNLRASLQQIYDLYRSSLLNVKYYGH